MPPLDDIATIDHGVLRFLTAGSVDDGKSTLIGRLLHDSRAILADQLSAVRETSRRRGQALDLSLFTDGLVAEREQGITIDVAYRYFGTARRKFIIADAPGHVQYTRNMVTAASTADAAVLLVDARRGVVAQTRRHAMLAHLLRVPHLVLAVNKMDLVGWDREAFDAIAADFRAFADAHGIVRADAVPLSAAEGDMVVERGDRLGWYRGPTLLQCLESLPATGAHGASPLPASAPQPHGGRGSVALRVPVQYVARAPDGARRYLARVEAGTLATGDAVRVAPSGRAVRIASLHGHAGVAIAHAAAPADIAFTVDGDVDIARGDMLVDAASLSQARRAFAADLCWLGDAPLDARRTWVLRIGTRSLRARVRSIASRFDADTGLQVAAQPAADAAGPADGHPPFAAAGEHALLGANGIARVSVEVADDVIADRYAEARATGSFILVDEASHDTVAAGMIA